MLKAEVLAKMLSEGTNPAHKDPLAIVPTPDLVELAKSGSASIDLRLGTWFAALRPARIPYLKSGGQSSEARLAKATYVPFGRDYILHPRSFLLGVTLEWVRFPSTLAAYVIGKSSWGRRGLIIATATAVHPGFTGCLTLELSNLGETPISIQPGMLICQLCFHRTESLDGAETVDTSRFVAQRKPSLGKVNPDDIAKDLFKAYGGSNGH